MAVFKCKMCGGALEVKEGYTVAVCEYCGTKQTLPRSNDDVVANLFNRANNLRLKNEFDKAEQVYEKIVEQDDTEAEAHWGIVLCKYGIEYVEDPKTFTRIPTCHRTLFDAVTTDPDYLAALENADASRRAMYEAEGKEIDRIQKDILAIVKKEEPFDVFLCYKETDDNGKRTVDSTIANDLYYQLTQQGFKVFYAAITLEDKLGTAYEPYIFAALNSAKVMVVLGTKPEYFDAVWVKNEWSRYLKLMKNDRNRLLIPCYRDMDAYDLPDEFSHLQAQDMSKIGFINDLVRGIRKVVQGGEEKAAPSVSAPANAGSAVQPLLKRAFMFLEDGDFKSANEYCEKVLDQDPENAEAYLGKLMAELQVKNRKQLADCEAPFDERDNFNKAIRFGDAALETELRGCISHINERNEEQAEICRKDAIYASAKSKMSSEMAISYKIAIEAFQTISGWKDADELILVCQRKIEEIEAKEEADRLEAEKRRLANAKKLKKAMIIGTPIVCACIAFLIVLNTVIIPNQKHHKALALIESESYDEAYAILTELGKTDEINQNKYDRAVKLLEEQKYDDAYALLEEIEDTEIINQNKYDRAVKLLEEQKYDDAYALLEEIENTETIKQSKYDRAVQFISDGNPLEAYALLKELDYKDSAAKLEAIKPTAYKALLQKAKVGETVMFGTYEQDNDTANGKEDIEWRVLAKEGNKILVISKYALDSKPYNTGWTNVTWETCSLRKWLNDTFLNTAFSGAEKSKILTTAVTADKNPNFNTDPGKATQDKVFLLSIAEAKEYFSSHSKRECAPTKYAIANGAYTSDAGNCWWWLRSPGSIQHAAAYADSDDGSVDYAGFDVNFVSGAVRPALWINLDA